MFAQQGQPLASRIRVKRSQLLDRKSLSQALKRAGMTQQLKRSVLNLAGKLINALVQLRPAQSSSGKVASQFGIHRNLAVRGFKTFNRSWTNGRLRLCLLLQSFGNCFDFDPDCGIAGHRRERLYDLILPLFGFDNPLYFQPAVSGASDADLIAKVGSGLMDQPQHVNFEFC